MRTGLLNGCARAASGHSAADAALALMKSRRSIASPEVTPKK
jgi:hypothetical protein